MLENTLRPARPRGPIGIQSYIQETPQSLPKGPQQASKRTLTHNPATAAGRGYDSLGRSKNPPRPTQDGPIGLARVGVDGYVHLLLLLLLLLPFSPLIVLLLLLLLLLIQRGDGDTGRELEK